MQFEGVTVLVARSEGDNHRIAPGDTSADLWTKTLPFERVPALVNPRSGYVMNANNTPWVAAGPGSELDPAAFSPLMGIEDDMTNRAVRLIDNGGACDIAELYMRDEAFKAKLASLMHQLLTLN